MSDAASMLVTLLFTDLVGSTELLSRTGDEKARLIFAAHHDLLTDTVAHHGGHEVKWLGDGLMVAFPSASDALSCAIAMQQAAHRPVGGERLEIRVGLTAGEAMRDSADYFGTPVVMAKRLCDRAAAGQILCSDLVAGLLAGRPGFAFAAVGELDLKGLPHPVAAYEVRYEPDTGSPFATATPLVGRDRELARLVDRLGDVSRGRGGLVLLAGEAGIGKTRLAEEAAAVAEREGAFVLWGRCFEGEYAPPYAPLAEALAPHVAVAGREELRADLGAGGAALAQLVPGMRDALVDLADLPPVPPEEERFRLLDAMAQSGRTEEAAGWFAEARRVLDEQGALPLLAQCDYDEALMYHRLGTPAGDARAKTLLGQAWQQFARLKMRGWSRRADQLAAQLG